MNETLMTILLMSLSGSVLAIILFLLKPLIGNHVSKAFLYYIWLPVLLRLIVPFGFPVNVAYETPPAPGIAPVSLEPAGNIPLPENAVPVPPGDTGGQFTVPDQAVPVADMDTDAAPKSEETFDFVPFLLNGLGDIWLTGAAISFGWYLGSYAVFYRRFSRSFASPSVADLEVFNTMPRTGNVRLVTSAETKTPMHMGVLRPVIVLPQIDYTANGMEKELRDVLRHELTHWRRHDILYKWFAVLVQSMHWFNPVVYFIRREIDKSCELSCDEAVVRGLNESDRISYGNTLLTLASEHAIPKCITAMTLSEGKKQLKERIMSIRDYKKSSHAMVALMLVMAIALTGCATAIAAVGTDIADGREEETVPVSGWLYGDDTVLFYVMEQYDIDGKKIVSGTYLETGHRDGGDYKLYTVSTEDDGTYLLTAHGELKPQYFLFRDTGRRGPEFSVTGISFAATAPDSAVPVSPVSDFTEEYIPQHSSEGFSRIFTYGDLTIAVTDILSVGTISFIDDMAEMHEYPVYICAPGAVATVYGADMDAPAYTEDRKAHAQWAYYTMERERVVDIVDGMAPVTVFETLSVCHIGSGTPVLRLEIPIYDEER